MSNRSRRMFLPCVEGVEQRCAATADLAGAAVAAHAFEIHAQAIPHHQTAHPFLMRGQQHLRHRPHSGPVTGSMPTTIVNGSGTFHFRLPPTYLDWGVVTLWNNTNGQVTFGVSASSYNNGQYYSFTLNSGQRQSFFAPVVNNQAPLFRVSFSPNYANPISLPQDNIVFESPNYVPQATAGWPYAINFGLNTYSISQI